MLFTTRNHRLLVFLFAKAPKGTKRSLALRGTQWYLLIKGSVTLGLETQS